MENSKEITIYDIAKSLNVSPSTVSRGLKDDPLVSKKTRKKIVEMATQMGYRSNLFARNLRQQTTSTIGVIACGLNSSVMTSVLSGIEKTANEAGYGIIITDSSGSLRKESANAGSLFNRRVDGLIVFPTTHTNNLDHFKPFIEKQIPIIFLDRISHLPQSTSVVIDNFISGYMATKHLIEQGCRRIAHTTLAPWDDNYLQRFKGYMDALNENEIMFEDELLVIAAPTEEESENAAKKICAMQPLPDGLFASDDFSAAVIIRTFLEHGIRVPEDIAVVGFNNDVIGKLIKPALTTIHYPGMEMGTAAAGILFNQLSGIGSTGNISTITVRTELIIRQSSLKK